MRHYENDWLVLSMFQAKGSITWIQDQTKVQMRMSDAKTKMLYGSRYRNDGMVNCEFNYCGGEYCLNFTPAVLNTRADDASLE